MNKGWKCRSSCQNREHVMTTEQTLVKLCIISTGLNLLLGQQKPGNLSCVEDPAPLSHPHIPQHSTSIPQCQDAAPSPAAASSPVLLQLPEASTTGQLLGTNRRGFCKFAII